MNALNALVEKHPRWSFWMCYERRRLTGYGWNLKRVYRVYTAIKPRSKKIWNWEPWVFDSLSLAGKRCDLRVGIRYNRNKGNKWPQNNRQSYNS